MQKLIKIWVNFLLKAYPLVLLLGLVLAGFSMPRMISLFKNISTDPVDLLPRNYPSVQEILKVRDKVESHTRFAIVLESEAPENTKWLMKDLKEKIVQNPLVGKVEDTKIGYHFFDKHKILYLELDDLKTIRDRVDRKIQHTKLGSLYVDLEGDEDSGELDFKDLDEKYKGRYSNGTRSEYYVSPNGKIFSLFVESKETNLGLSGATQFQESIRSILNGIDLKSYDSTMKLYFAGTAKVIEYRALVRDLKIAGIISGFLIFLPLLIRFRKPQFVLLIFIPLILGIPMGLALTSFWVKKLNITTSFLFAILGGLGVETGIHLFSRYHEKRHSGVSPFDSLMDIYEFYGPAVFTSVASLATTFLLMTFSDFKGFSEFGFISGVGLWVLFILYFTLFPALLVFAEKIHLLRFKGEFREPGFNFMPSPRYVKFMLVLFSLITIFSIMVIPRIRFEYNTKKIRADNKETRLAKQKERATIGKRFSAPAVVLIRNVDEAKAIAQAMNEKKEKNPNSIIDNTFSYFSLVPEQQKEKMGVVNEIQKLLSDDTIKLVKDERKKDLDRFKEALHETTPVKSEEVPPEVVDMFVGKRDQPGYLFLVNSKAGVELDDGRNAIAFANEVEEIKTPLGTFHATSDAVVFADVLKTMFRDSKKVLFISVASVCFFVFLDFRSLKKTLLVMFSILSGVLWVMGVMYLTHIKLNLYNMVMIPSIMGMSIDNSIHVYHSYEELGKGSLGKVLSTTGVSAFLASATNASGFIGLLFCFHGGLRSMGVVATIGLITCLISTLLFLPMILQFLEWRSNHRGSRRDMEGEEFPLAPDGKATRCSPLSGTGKATSSCGFPAARSKLEEFAE